MGMMLKRKGLKVKNVSDIKEMPDGCKIQGFLIDNFLSMQSFRYQNNEPTYTVQARANIPNSIYDGNSINIASSL